MWKLLRAHIWTGRRLFWAGAPWQQILKIVLLAALGVGLVWVYNTVVTVLRAGEGLFTLAGFVPMALIMLIFFMLFGLSDTLQRLYLASDMDLLMAAPIPPRNLYLSRLLLCSQALWIPASFVGGVLLAFGQATRAPWVYYPLALGLLLAALLIFTATGMLVVIGLARIMPPRQARNLIPVLLTLFSLAGVILQQPMLRAAVRVAGLVEASSAATFDVARFAPLVGVVLGVALLLLWAGYGVFAGAFYRGWLGMRESAPTHGTPKRRANGRYEALLQPFPPVMRTILRKDWQMLARSPQQLMNLFVIPVLMLALLFPMLKPDNSLYALRFWALLIYSAMFMVNASQATGMAALAEEGPNFALLRVSPVTANTLLWAKFVSKWLPATLVWSGVYVAAAFLTQLALWELAALSGFTLWCMGGTTFLGLAAGARHTHFDVDDPKQRIAPVAAWMATGLALAFIICACFSFSLGLIRFAPQTASVQAAWQALGAFPRIARTVEEAGLGLILAGAIGQVALGSLGWMLWRNAVRRLATWEIT